MIKTFFAITTLFVTSAVLMPALDLPCYGQTGAISPQAGQRKGKKPGSHDGKGPIHTPGTGGGTGAGRRAGRR